jgi:hypothetical protein
MSERELERLYAGLLRLAALPDEELRALVKSLLADTRDALARGFGHSASATGPRSAAYSAEGRSVIALSMRDHNRVVSEW